MEMNRYRRRWTAWLASLAILAAALAPSISYALAAMDRAGFSTWADICSADAVDAPQADSESVRVSIPGDSGLHLKHCPFCFTHAGSFALLPVDAPLIPPAAGSPIRPPLFLHSPRPLFAWRAARPRAPPVAS